MSTRGKYLRIRTVGKITHCQVTQLHQGFSNRLSSLHRPTAALGYFLDRGHYSFSGFQSFTACGLTLAKQPALHISPSRVLCFCPRYHLLSCPGRVGCPQPASRFAVTFSEINKFNPVSSLKTSKGQSWMWSVPDVGSGPVLSPFI